MLIQCSNGQSASHYVVLDNYYNCMSIYTYPSILDDYPFVYPIYTDYVHIMEIFVAIFELPVSIGQDNLPPFDTRTALEVIEEDLAAVKDWCFMGHGSESCPQKNTCFLVGKMMIEHAMFGSSQFSDNPNWWKFKLVNLSLGYY